MVTAATPEALVRQLGEADAAQRTRALAALVRIGAPATPALIDALSRPDVGWRARAAQALAEIGDPATAEPLAATLNDPSPDVRGRAAQGLARLGDPRAPAALAATIDTLPDVLHSPYTVAVYALIGLGEAALPVVAPLLASSERNTRVRAWLVLRSVVEGLPDVGEWAGLAAANGGYGPDAAQGQRDVGVQAWREWIGRRPGGSG